MIFAKINVVDREILEPFRKRADEILKDIDPNDISGTRDGVELYGATIET